MQTSDKQALGVNVLAHSSSDILTAVPIKKRRFMLTRSPSPPHDISPSLPANSDVTQKSSEPESSVSETFSQPALGTTMARKGSCEMIAESTVRKDLNGSPKHENLPRSSNHGLVANMDGKDTSQAKEFTPDNICRLLPVTGATQLLSAKDSYNLPEKERCSERKHVPNDTSTFPTVSGNAKFQLAFKDPVGFPEDLQNSDSIFITQEKSDSCPRNIASAARNLQSKCNDAESNVESSLLCLNRSNWDLNTTMDAWEDLPNDSALDSANGSHNLDVGGIHDKRPGLEPVQMLCKVADGADAIVGKFILGKNVGSSSLSMSLNDGSNPETCLDLQLKPSFMTESFFKWGHKRPLDKVDSIKDMPLLSLSVKPVLTDCNSTLVACRAVKTESCDQGNQEDHRNIRICGLKSPVEHVKSEPCEGQQNPERLSPSDLISACNAVVKSESLEDQSQGYLRKQDSLLTSQSTEISQGVPEHVSMALESSVSDDRLLYKSTQLDGAIIHQDPSQIVMKTLESVIQGGPVPQNNEVHHAGKTLICTDIPRYGKENVTESSDLDHESLASKGKNSHLLDATSKFVAWASASSKPYLYDIHEHLVASGKSEVVGQTCCADGHISSNVASAEESPIDFSVKSMGVESSEKKIEQFADSLEKPLDLEREPSSHEETGTVVVHKQSSEDDEYEDGEVRNLALQGIEKGDRERNQIKAADSSCPIDVHIEMTSCIDLKEDKIENPEESKVLDTKNFDDGRCCHEEDPENSTITNVNNPSAVDVPTTGSVKRILSKTIQKVPQVQLEGKKPERKSKSDKALSASTGTIGSHDDVRSQQLEALLLENFHVSKNETSIEDEAEEEKGCGSSIIGHKPVPDGSTSEKGKSFSGRMISLRMEKERFVENSLVREKSQSQRIRDEKNQYRSQLFERARNKYLQLGRRRSSLMHSSRKENQINNLSSERNPNHKHVFKQVGSSGTKYARPINASEDALAVAPNSPTGNSGRMARMLRNDDLQNLSNTSCRGRLPSRRGRIPVGNQLNCHPTKDVNPSRRTGRDGSDFLLRAHEERLMCTLPDDRMFPMVPRACPQYERMGGNPIRRERRSLSPLISRERSISPIQWRVPLEYPPICMESSPRSLAQQLHQWSPPRRSPDSFNEPPLMGRAIMPDRRRSPHQRLTEDMIVRRGSPPYIARLPDDIDSSRERGFSRPVRSLQRTIRRFHTIDSHDFSEEYLSPVLRDQCDELVRDVECDDRSCNGRHERCVTELRRPFRQHHILRDDVNKTFISHVDGGGPGPYRFCHEDEGFPERGSPKEYEGNIRNRLGGRSTVTEEQEDYYRYHGETAWRDEGISDVRQKRRRVERH